MNYNNSNNYDGYTLHEETRKAFMRLIIYCTVGWAMIMAGFGLALGNSSSFLGVILILGGPIIIAIPFLNKLHGGLNLAHYLRGHIMLPLQLIVTVLKLAKKITRILFLLF